MYRPIDFDALDKLLSGPVNDRPPSFEIPSNDLDALAIRLGPNINLSRFQTDLTRALRRFAANQGNHEAMPNRRIATRQLSQLETHATKLLDKLDELDPRILALLCQNYGNFPLALPPRYLNDLFEWDLTGNVQHERIIWVLSWLLRSIRAANEETSFSAPRNRKNDPLERLMDDLEHVFNTETGTRAASANYYNGAKGEYEGAFYDFSKDVIQRFWPQCFYSNAAWGKLIARALKRQ